MNCIMFRPSVRWMQVSSSSGSATDGGDAGDGSTTRKGAVPASRGHYAGPSPTSPLSGGGMPTFSSFHTKESRIAHVEEQRSILVHVTVDLDVAAQFCPPLNKPTIKAASSLPRGGVNDDPLVVLTLSLPPSATIHAAIGVVVEQFLALRRCAGQSTALHHTSLYHRVVDNTTAAASAAKFRDVPAGLLALALLQSDLTLAVCDAAGAIVKPLRRFVVPKSAAASTAAPSSSSSPVPSSLADEKAPKLSASSTVSQVAQALTAAQCSSAGFTVAQKSILNHLSSFVEPSLGGTSNSSAGGRDANKSMSSMNRSTAAGKATLVGSMTEESKFQPPYSLLLYVDEGRARLRSLQAKEHASREALFLEASGFLHSFAIPYWNRFLQSDCALRADWIVYQAHCRHRIHLLEREGRCDSQQRTAFREECESRRGVEDEEFCERQMVLKPWSERLAIESYALVTAWQTVVLRADAEFLALRSVFESEREQVERLLSFKDHAINFCEVQGPETEELTRREMLQVLHDSAVALQSRKLHT